MHTCRRILAGTFALGLAGFALAACGADAAPSQKLPGTAGNSGVTIAAPAKGPATAEIEIPGQDRFSPFVTSVAPMGTITIENRDTDEHTVSSLPGAPIQFDLHVPANGAKTLQLPAGVYRYYCTAHAKYDDKTGQVASLPSANFPDQPMEGIIVAG
jgi:plastocyanin